MAIQIIGLDGNVAKVDADNNLYTNLPLDVLKPGFAATASEVDPGLFVARTVRPDDTSADFRKRVGLDTPQWYQPFAGAILDTNNWLQSVTTMTIAQVAGQGIRLNSGSSVASGASAAHFTYRTFSQQGTMPLYGQTQLKYISTGLQAGVRVQFGLMLGAAGAALPTDGVYFVYEGAFLYGVVNFAGVEVTPVLIDPAAVPAVNDEARYLICVYTDYAEFWINEALVARVDSPASNPSLTSSPNLQWATRMTNASAPAAAVIIQVGRVAVDLGDAFSGQSWEFYLAGNGGGSFQTQPGVASGQTALWANSAAPAAGTLSNTALPAAAYNTLGGLFDYNAPVGGATDYIAFAYQVPAASNALPGKNLWIKSVSIFLYNAGAAVATTPTVVVWGLGIGGSALSLATADSATTRSAKRIPLGQHSLAVATPIGGAPPEGNIRFRPDIPLMVEPGTFVHLIARVPIGTATALQRLQGGISIVAVFG